MESCSFLLPKGNYFFGDLSFLFKNIELDPYISDSFRCNKLKDDWQNIICMNGDGKWKYEDKEYVWFVTKGATGEWISRWVYNLRGREEDRVYIDTGNVGLIPTDVIDSEVLEKVVRTKKGFIYSSDSELKIDLYGEKFYNFGVHIYKKREHYSFSDDAILISFHSDELEEETKEYFISQCPPFKEGEESDWLGMNLTSLFGI